MGWINKTGRIVCLNLSHREDRLLDFTKMMEQYQIPFERIEAIHDKESGARGLRDTMVKLFTEEIEKGTEHLLVFEDDCEFKVPPETLNDTMNKVMEQLPVNYHFCFLGCQLTSNKSYFHSSNLINVSQAFSTHAVLYSLQGMREMIGRGLGYPIDNWMVEHLEPLGCSYCTYPLLASQRPGQSDIYNNFIDWAPFIDQKFEQQVNKIRR